MTRPTTALLLLTAGLAVLQLAAAAAPASGRRLLQSSPPPTCEAAIPGCEAEQCINRGIGDQDTWVCLRCAGTYEPLMGTGSDITACVCPRGHYEVVSDKGNSCARCERDFYCPGGKTNEDRGTSIACDEKKFLTTRTTGSFSSTQCVALAGHARGKLDEGPVECGPSTYAPANNRLTACIRCPGGLVEDAEENLKPAQRDSAASVCRTPPGSYMSQGQVRQCPPGSFRSGYATANSREAQPCVACPDGVTTAKPGSDSKGACNVPKPGFGVKESANLEVSATDGLPALEPCGLGFYQDGFVCRACPDGSVTKQLGATSVLDCLVPPGYLLTKGSGMELCGDGTYRSGWLLHSDARAAKCTACGRDIKSEPNEKDENPLVKGGTVRATSDACYIEAGWSMVSSAGGGFAARPCPAASYGPAETVWGLRLTPCRPCPKNMVTDITPATSLEHCINPAGFGIGSDGSAAACPTGSFTGKASMEACTRCAAGRTTLVQPAVAATDCVVLPGHGVTNPDDPKAPFAVDVESRSKEELAKLPVLQCPVGLYSEGNGVGSPCMPCAAGATTEDDGSKSIEDCTVCVAGKAKDSDAPDAACSDCDFGSFQAGGAAQCTACPDTTWFWASLDDKLVSKGVTTQRGATGSHRCVPHAVQLAPEAGQAFFAGESLSVATHKEGQLKTIEECTRICDENFKDTLCLAQFDGAVCYIGVLKPAESTDTSGRQLLYKLPPAGGVTGAGTARIKSLASGVYARGQLPDDEAWLKVGGSLDKDALTGRPAARQAWDKGEKGAGTDEESCRAKCDASSVCIAFVWSPEEKACLYRTGAAALRTRSAAVLPEMTPELAKRVQWD